MFFGVARASFAWVDLGGAGGGLGLLLASGSGSSSRSNGGTFRLASLKGLETAIKQGELCLDGSERCLKGIHRLSATRVERG